jgi:aspartyl aminopeptidase
MEQKIKRLMDFIDASPTPFQAVDNLISMLGAMGAQALDERQVWQLEPGAVYYVSRGGSSLIAFRMGLKAPAEAGFLLAGAHTDSPALKIRPEKELQSRGYMRLALESYGAPILSGWLDRPLGLAGNIAVRENDSVLLRFYISHEPFAVIPNLAIHLNRDINKGFEYNLHQHMPALFGLVCPKKDEGAAAQTVPEGLAGTAGTSEILARVAAELGVEPAAIVSADLRLFDIEASRLIDGSLINAPRLDDLAGCAAVMEAFTGVEAQAATQVACFFDAEEIGSMTPGGAQSSYLRDILARITLASRNSGQDFYRALSYSSCVSVDASQAWHPGYPDKFDEFYTPVLGKGIAVKSNANMNYATDFTSLQIAETAAAKAKVNIQHYMARADIQPGKTIGPITASRTGISTVDVGHPLLAMHAIRETIAASDHLDMIGFLRAFYS